jgi:hypothetical protein
VAYPSHVGPVVGGSFPEEEQVEQEVPGGPQAPSCEVCITCRILYDGDRLYGSTLLYVILVIEVFMFMTRCAMLS